MKSKRVLSAAMAAVMTVGIAAAQISVFADDVYATRGQAAEMLAIAADDYNSGVKKTDIIKGYEDGELHEEQGVTRAEALVMLKRAFNNLPEPTGHNARVALAADNFTDLPDWAKTDLADVFNAGIAAGTEEGIFSPDEPVTQEQLELFIKRVYALYGTNEKDDFYAAVNKEALNNLEIKPGRVIAGTLYDVQDKSTEQVNEIISDMVSKKHEKGTKEQKVSDFYNSIMDKESRNKVGIAPLKPYLELIDKAESINDLTDVQAKTTEELYCAPFMAYSLSVDLKDSTKYMPLFAVYSPNMTKDFYETGTQQQKDIYLKYVKNILTLGGEKDADVQAERLYEFEKKLAEKMLNPEDGNDVDKIYNVYSLDEIKAMFKGVDIDSVVKSSGLKEEDKILIYDVAKTEEFAKLFTEENIDVLKTAAKFGILAGLGGALNTEFTDVSDEFSQEYFGVSGTYTDEERATIITESVMPDYIGKAYVEKYFSEKAKQDVTKMVNDIISVYEKRIDSLTWMSDATKAKAKEKLNKMNVKIGYPDKWDNYFDEIEIKSVEDGGSYFENILAISAANRKKLLSYQGTAVDKTKWIMYPFTVNACYNSTANDITFPAAILQPPMYDVNASYEENLGSIGYFIAHEITHAFDNNGAKFDANGNAADWWTKEDYAEFEKLCEKMQEFYEGQESIPGIPMNGKLTLSENVADQGAVACITEVAAGLENPDFKALYRSMAKTWASTETREYAGFAAANDVHSDDKIRINRVIVNCDEFYEAFGISEGDGMYVAPEDRVKIW